MKTSVCFACCGLILGFAVGQQRFFQAASLSAQTTSARKCDYTYIRDGSRPDIGTDGEIKYNESWKKVLDGGWILKATAGSEGSVYVFEKCR